jgi:hypothetical protein
MAEAVEAYQDEHNLTDAEAVRRLVAAGLEHESQPTREEIATELEEVAAAVRGVRREIDTDDDNEIVTRRAEGMGLGCMIGVVVAVVATTLFVLEVTGVAV